MKIFVRKNILLSFSVVAAENAGSCGVMRALGFTPTENGTFRRSGSQTEYKNLTFKKEL